VDRVENASGAVLQILDRAFWRVPALLIRLAGIDSNSDAKRLIIVPRKALAFRDATSHSASFVLGCPLCFSQLVYVAAMVGDFRPSMVHLPLRTIAFDRVPGNGQLFLVHAKFAGPRGREPLMKACGPAS
jgi:hypothetical protein